MGLKRAWATYAPVQPAEAAAAARARRRRVRTAVAGFIVEVGVFRVK
jgi:hypothetical protein